MYCTLLIAYELSKLINMLFVFMKVFSSFASAAIKVQTSKAFKMNRHGIGRDNSSVNPEYYTGQLLKESMLNLGPTFVKGKMNNLFK